MSDNEVTTVKNEIPVLGTGSYLPFGKEAEMISQWAKYIAASPYYKSMGGEAAVLSIWLTARELGVPVMSALNGGVYFVQGKVMLSASCMSMLIRKAGHSIKKKIGNDEVCHLIGTRSDNGDTMENVFTMQHAKKAGLIKAGGIWEKYPSRMLFNRALSNLAKDLFSDCIGSAYIEGELDNAIIDIPVAEEPKKMNKESMLFIDRFGLLDLTCNASRFIDSIAANTGMARNEVIEQCSKESDKFGQNLELFEKKLEQVKTK